MASNKNYILSRLYFHVKKTSVSAVPFFFNFTHRRKAASTLKCYRLSILDSDFPFFLHEKKKGRNKGVGTRNGR